MWEVKHWSIETNRLYWETDNFLLNPELCVDDKVYVRNCGVRGRNKIQDTWDSTIYRVLRLSENTVVVEPEDGAGVSRTLNRQHVIKCNVPQCKDRNSDVTCIYPKNYTIIIFRIERSSTLRK